MNRQIDRQEYFKEKSPNFCKRQVAGYFHNRQPYWSRSNKENYPKWFTAIDDHNKEFGDLGYGCKCRFCPGSRINPKKAQHQLGHYAILQTPLHKEVKIVIVGKNNS